MVTTLADTSRSFHITFPCLALSVTNTCRRRRSTWNHPSAPTSARPRILLRALLQVGLYGRRWKSCPSKSFNPQLDPSQAVAAHFQRNAREAGHAAPSRAIPLVLKQNVECGILASMANLLDVGTTYWNARR